MEMANSVSQQNTFKESKEEIIKIYSEVFNYVNDSDEFLRSIHNSGAMFQALINADDVILLSNVVEKMIQSVISRDNMKCAFFGRTSNGKSTTINAMLGDRILPAGIGHTTRCFLEIRGTTDSQASVSIISSPKSGSDSPPVELVGHKKIDSVLERARELSTESLIRIAWPSQKCALLSEDVVILDSPGIDADPDIDKWIDMYCLDADVFVLVVNSTSALNHMEKEFLHKVCNNRLSKPNVFILNNYWDKITKNPNSAKIREQHMERCVNFLTKELKVCSKTEAENRVFFVSAKEVLSERSKNNEWVSGVPTSPDYLGSKPRREGWQSRQSEFTKFEEILGKTLSESATKTKFAAHSRQGQDIVGEVRCIVDAIIKKAQYQKDAAVRDWNEMQTRCSRLASLRSAAHKESSEDIWRVSDKVFKMVADKLHNGVQHLDNIIDKFNHKFSDEPGQLNQYKIDLNKHVEDHFKQIMKELWDNELCKQVKAVNTAISGRYQALVRDDDVSKAMRQSECDIDYRSMSFDFHDAVSSVFSVGPTKSEAGLPPASSPRGKDVSKAMRQSECDIDCQSISSDFQENISWFSWGVFKRSLIDRLSFLEAKEMSLKAQFRSHMIDRLKPLITDVSRQSAVWSQFALNATLKRLDTLVQKHEQKLRADIAQLQSDIQRLEEILAKSRNLTDTAHTLENEFKGFHNKYIRV